MQTAHGYTLADGKLTLTGVNPNTVFFSDRPDRIAGHGLTSEFCAEWTEGDDSFSKNPPNADLSAIVGDKHLDAVVVLRNARLSGGDLTYDVEILEGELPPAGGAASLFIDVIGRPLTPVSVAGAARRTTRRVVRRRVVMAPRVVVVR